MWTRICINIGLKGNRNVLMNVIESKSLVRFIGDVSGSRSGSRQYENKGTGRKGTKKNTANDNFIRIRSMNDGRGGRLKSFRVESEIGERERFIFKGKSDQFAHIDPESLNKLDENLELYSRNEQLYHEKVVDEDMSQRRRLKLAIVRKKMKKLEGGELDQERPFNLLTWDAKEQIKHLNLNNPGNKKRTYLSI